MKEERKILQKEVFPKLKEYCKERDAQIQVIDLRWGISENLALNQETMNICLKEIKRCQNITPRPNFIVLLGNRYGWRPLPNYIPKKEFQQILSLCKEKNLEKSEILEKWYILDENIVPAMYQLKKREDKYIEEEIWKPTENKIRELLTEATPDEELTEEQFIRHSASATEQEIHEGILKVSENKDHAFCFFREIQNRLEPSMTDYIDLDSNEKIDVRAQERLKNLKNIIRNYFSEDKTKIYEYPAF